MLTGMSEIIKETILSVLTSLITNNSQERKVESLVVRLGEDITRQAREMLLGARKN